MARRLRIVAGLVGLATAIVGIGFLVAVERGEGTRDVVASLWEHYCGDAPERPLDAGAGGLVRAGDPVFAETDARRFALVGRVVAAGDALVVRFRPGAAALHGAVRLRAYRSDDSVAWVLRTLVPEGKRDIVRALLRKAFDQHRRELAAALEPVLLEGFRDAVLAIQAEIPAVIRSHRDELQELGVAYQDELVRDQLLPMAQARLLPLIVSRSRPLLTELGEEIWTRVSLWRVGSRYVWDRLPLTSGTSLEQEWQRVLDEEVVPVIEARVPEFVELTREIVRAAAADPQIRSTVREAIGRVVEDPRVHALAVSMFRQAVVDNRPLRDALAARWRSDEARAAFELTERRLQPTAVRIGEILFGVRGEGISPELAAVLRNRLLLKDRRWLVLERGDAPGPVPELLTVEPGRDDIDPFQPEAAPEDGR